MQVGVPEMLPFAQLHYCGTMCNCVLQVVPLVLLLVLVPLVLLVLVLLPEQLVLLVKWY
jgi:hypothetical protein